MTWLLLDLGETLKVVGDVDSWRIVIILFLIVVVVVVLVKVFPYKESLLCA